MIDPVNMEIIQRIIDAGFNVYPDYSIFIEQLTPDLQESINGCALFRYVYPSAESAHGAVGITKGIGDPVLHYLQAYKNLAS